MIILHHDIFFFWLCVFLCTFLCISFMESFGQKRARISSVVEASSSASATPGDDDPRKNKVGRRDADGKEELRSEPSTSHTPPNPFPEAPSIDFLRKRIKTVLKSCRNRYPADRLLRSTYSDLHLETASAEKRIKIAQVLEDMSKRSQDFRSNKREQPHTDLIIQICDWEQDHLRKRNSLV